MRQARGGRRDRLRLRLWRDRPPGKHRQAGPPRRNRTRRQHAHHRPQLHRPGQSRQDIRHHVHAEIRVLGARAGAGSGHQPVRRHGQCTDAMAPDGLQHQPYPHPGQLLRCGLCGLRGLSRRGSALQSHRPRLRRRQFHRAPDRSWRDRHAGRQTADRVQARPRRTRCSGGAVAFRFPGWLGRGLQRRLRPHGRHRGRGFRAHARNSSLLCQGAGAQEHRRGHPERVGRHRRACRRRGRSLRHLAAYPQRSGQEGHVGIRARLRFAGQPGRCHRRQSGRAAPGRLC